MPFSHQQDWNIQDCYEGVHDEYFLENAEQHDMPKGSVFVLQYSFDAFYYAIAFTQKAFHSID